MPRANVYHKSHCPPLTEFADHHRYSHNPTPSTTSNSTSFLRERCKTLPANFIMLVYPLVYLSNLYFVFHFLKSRYKRLSYTNFIFHLTSCPCLHSQLFRRGFLYILFVTFFIGIEILIK